MLAWPKSGNWAKLFKLYYHYLQKKEEMLTNAIKWKHIYTGVTGIKTNANANECWTCVYIHAAKTKYPVE